MIALIITGCVVMFLYVLSTMCRRGHKGLKALRDHGYAHRGLHNAKIPENSMAAFEQAMTCGYGVELDVHLLRDGNLAVIHDSLLQRTVRSSGVVEELTADDLNTCFLEGTLQTIPLLTDVLKLFDGRVPMVVELKCHNNNYDELCRKTCALMDTYSGPYCMESFDPRCVYWLRKNRPDIIRGQLTKNYFKTSNSKLPWILKFILVNQMLNFLTLPDFVACQFSDRRCFSNFLIEKLWGAQSVTWTLTTQEKYDMALQEGRIPIFEGFCP